MRSAGKVKIEIMNYEIVLLLHQSVQETLMMGANSGRHQEEEMKVSIMLIIANIISIIVNMVSTNIIINIIMMGANSGRHQEDEMKVSTDINRSITT